MKKTKLLFIIGLLATSLTSFISCSPKQAVDETKQKVEEGYDKAKEKVKEGVDNIFNDDEAKFNLTSLKDDLKAKGFEPKEKESKNNAMEKLFSVSGKILSIKNGEIYVYEYNKDQKDKLKNDLNSIQNNNSIMNGGDIKWNVSPHFYSKGRVVVVYDGNNQEILNALSEIMGMPLVG
ncbi:hypothetical protein [Clostridium sp. Ade.TY]|uniref:hypothetical protein n=1 Tax=Clostridium sp. Ade.TY TaxID=1391647 RepID=UPI00040EA6EB|nr:hypothetical protein [Clostridium sp. Ade.TY]